MQTEPSYDAIVVGARCAGAPVAMRLAQKGHRVLLLDRERVPSEFAMSTHFIHPHGLAKLRDWGILDTLPLDDCAPIGEMTLRSGGLEIHAEIPEVDGLRAGYAPRRFVLDRCLVDAATSAGVELRCPCEVRALLRDGERVCGVQAVEPDGGEHALRANLVIGADGPASRVAKEVGAREHHRRPALQGTIWGYYSGMPTRGFQIDQDVGKAVYRFPTSGATLVGVNIAQPQFKEASRDPGTWFHRLIAELTPDLQERMQSARLEEPLRRGATRNFFRDAVGPGWALVGDAGYKKDPCTAQGITDAFLDADALADAIDAGLSGGAPLSDALAEFQRARDAWALPFYELTCEMARFAAPDEQQLLLFQALAQSPEDAKAFVGLITEATEPASFFRPDNLERIVGSYLSRTG